jgi:hypothetical protein
VSYLAFQLTATIISEAAPSLANDARVPLVQVRQAPSASQAAKAVKSCLHDDTASH